MGKRIAAFIGVPLIFICGNNSFSYSQVSSSALINQALDSQVGELDVRGGLFDVMRSMESQTGVRLEATPLVWDSLPWGQDTTVTVRFRHTTVRDALDALTRRLGLTYRLGEEAVVIEPTPALARLGRRATLDEIKVLALLARTPLGEERSSVPLSGLMDDVDGKLREGKSSFAIENRMFDPQESGRIINVAHNATLMDALEEITSQTNGTWYPWGRSLVVAPKVEAIRLLLTKHLSRRYLDVPLGQVLAEISEFSGVQFDFSPGVLQRVPAKYNRVTLTVDDATVEQTLQILSGATGLKFTPTDQGVSVTFEPSALEEKAATQPLE